MDPRTLTAQLLRAREKVVPVGRFKFTIRRPTEMELVRSSRGKGELEVSLLTLQTNVVGWDGVLESDIVPGGASDTVPFDAALYQAWIEDRRDLWPELMSHIAAMIDENDKKIEGSRGN